MNVGPDAAALRAELDRRYAEVAAEPRGRFRYPVGRESVEGLGYARDRVAGIPRRVVERFVGVGNPFALGLPAARERVLDVGCGAGFDAWFAARCAGPAGCVIGVDPSRAMLRHALADEADDGRGIPRFIEARAEALPVADGWADRVVSNGALNLAVCKATALREIARVLRPGGCLQAADLVQVGELPAAVRDGPSAWSD